MKLSIKYVRPWGSYNHCGLWQLPRLVIIRHVILFGKGRDKISLVLKR